MKKRVFKFSCPSCNAQSINGIAAHENGCHGTLEFTKYGRKFTRFRVWSLDVLGNEQDGFEVNDRSEIGFFFTENNVSNEILLRDMKKKGWIIPRARFSTFEITGDDRSLYVNHKKSGMPLFELEAQ